MDVVAHTLAENFSFVANVRNAVARRILLPLLIANLLIGKRCNVRNIIILLADIVCFFLLFKNCFRDIYWCLLELCNRSWDDAKNNRRFFCRLGSCSAINFRVRVDFDTSMFVTPLLASFFRTMNSIGSAKSDTEEDFFEHDI